MLKCRWGHWRREITLRDRAGCRYNKQSRAAAVKIRQCNFAKDGNGDKEVTVINRIEGSWLRINDEQSRHQQRRQRRNKRSREEEKEEIARRPQNEKYTIDLVA